MLEGLDRASAILFRLEPCRMAVDLLGCFSLFEGAKQRLTVILGRLLDLDPLVLGTVSRPL